jgi:uncharacterized membrane protein YidH (DUF202 family)
VSYSAEGLGKLLERHELAFVRLCLALGAGGDGLDELDAFNAEWDAETARLSPDERRAVGAFLEALVASSAVDRES